MGKSKKKTSRNAEGVLATNRKALRDFHILERFEAGMVLKGSEVKSLRQGNASLQEGYAHIDDNLQLWLVGCNIQPYDHGNIFNHVPTRERKLLMHRKEIERLYSKIREKGLTLVPLKFYINHGKIKVQLALARGKNVVDKRETLKRKTSEMEAKRAMRNRNG